MGDAPGFCSLMTRLSPLGIDFGSWRWAKKTLNKFGFICLVKGEIFLDEDRKRIQRYGTIAQLSAQESQSLQTYPIVLDVWVNSPQRLENFCAFQLFSQDIWKYDLYLWKWNISSTSKRHLKGVIFYHCGTKFGVYYSTGGSNCKVNTCKSIWCTCKYLEVKLILNLFLYTFFFQTREICWL